jgi:hypothetical protein
MSNFGMTKYTSLCVTLQKKYSGGNQFLLSYNYQASTGNSSFYVNASQLGNAFMRLFKGDPQLADLSGPTIFDKPYDFKAFGSVTLPLNFFLAAAFNYTAGTPYTSYNYMTSKLVSAVGALRTDPTLNLNVRLEKDFRIGEMTLKLFAEAFNTTNKLNILEKSGDVSGRYAPYGQTLSVGEPRRIQLSARLEF